MVFKKAKKTLLVKKAEKALKKAVTNVIKEHKQKGIPLVVWRNGRVTKIPASQL